MVVMNEEKKLRWEEIKPNLPLFRQKLISEFLFLYNKFKDANNYPFKWGDEIEFSLYRFDHSSKKVQLLLKAKEFLDSLHDLKDRTEKHDIVEFHPEYTGYMVEAIPALPFDDNLNGFIKLEENIIARREILQKFLGQDEYVLSLTSFPRLGCKNFTWPHLKPDPLNEVNLSVFFPHTVILDNENMILSTKNINDRRGNKPVINIPIFADKNTPKPFVEDLSDFELSDEDRKLLKPDHIYMDANGFGMGCCCLQVTFQATSLTQNRHLYDQLTPVTPLVLALSAASPIWRGYLAQIDCRYNVIKEAMDDRTPEEFGKISARYDTIEIYLSEQGQKYNDIKVTYDEAAYKAFVENGVAEPVAKHYANYFIRDPLMLSQENFSTEDPEFTGNFEQIQTTVWRMLRFKTPPVKSEANNNIGWRIEFRPTELQLTNFENTAFATFIILLTRALAASPEINLLVPLTNVDTNMQRAVKYNAYLDEKFYFRKNIVNSTQQDEAVVEEMSINEIINGNGSDFKGLLSIINEYLDKHHKSADAETRARINNYLKLIELRASGKLLTSASWIRKYIDKHPKYNHDSVVSDEIAYDLLWTINQIQTDQLEAADLLPNFLKNKA